jgi:hypothetical protein
MYLGLLSQVVISNKLKLICESEIEVSHDATWTLSLTVGSLTPTPISKSSTLLLPRVFIYLQVCQIDYYIHIWRPQKNNKQMKKEQKFLLDLLTEFYNQLGVYKRSDYNRFATANQITA